MSQRQQRVAVFTSASCTGWAYAYRADEYQQQRVHDLAEQYNSVPAWTRRNGDGGVSVFDEPGEALAWHNQHVVIEDSEYQVADLDGLLAIYADDGDGERTTLSRVLLALCSDPLSEEAWPPSDEV